MAALEYSSAPLHPKTDVTYEPPGGTCFHAVLDKTTWVLILMNLHETEAIFEGHIARFIGIIPESFITHM
ncbi:uncharacterized protein N7443_005971 [Penicillium atrosanguineum]|uniref:uncharacterized protein n=1 Tax=Penicillium atrosanguineum TaxID=1132637 RepID=UPI0023A35D45|nr:uncharacterized protein N7443_005971 [Penicillium atrosanguineum]KAJ5300969.1 hypothetical protein N7443_005971 [Penicillium atrosanguineum]